MRINDLRTAFISYLEKGERVGCMVSIFERFCRKEDPRAGVFRIRIRVRVRVDSR